VQLAPKVLQVVTLAILALQEQLAQQVIRGRLGIRGELANRVPLEALLV
jgi:hypothetical protein